MDRKLVRMASRGRFSIEFCDLYENSKRLVHVKRYAGSSEMSHLFAQGAVSAELFANDLEFRKVLNEQLPEGFKMSQVQVSPNTSDYEVVYAIVTSSQKKERPQLPFFSKVMLRSASERIKSLGYSVKLLFIRSVVSAHIAEIEKE